MTMCTLQEIPIWLNPNITGKHQGVLALLINSSPASHWVPHNSGRSVGRSPVVRSPPAVAQWQLLVPCDPTNIIVVIVSKLPGIRRSRCVRTVGGRRRQSVFNVSTTICSSHCSSLQTWSCPSRVTAATSRAISLWRHQTADEPQGRLPEPHPVRRRSTSDGWHSTRARSSTF